MIPRCMNTLMALPIHPLHHNKLRGMHKRPALPVFANDAGHPNKHRAQHPLNMATTPTSMPSHTANARGPRRARDLKVAKSCVNNTLSKLTRRSTSTTMSTQKPNRSATRASGSLAVSPGEDGCATMRRLRDGLRGGDDVLMNAPAGHTAAYNENPVESDDRRCTGSGAVTPPSAIDLQKVGMTNTLVAGI